MEFMAIIMEKARKYTTPVLCFVDYDKAFDKVQRHLLWDILISMGIPNHLVKLIQSLYATIYSSLCKI